MLTYKAAGVDIEAGNELVRKIKAFAPEIGGFAGGFPLDNRPDGDVLVASTDGVGTKLALAIEMEEFDSIGQDLVAMCVNDLITVGARPLFFLDYYATGKLKVEQAEKVIRGISEACRMAGCLLLGGETAEMPGFYPDGSFDLAGFSVGLVKKDRWLDGRTIEKNDVLLGLPSSGLHSNGFSLVRRILSERKIELDRSFQGRSLGEVLLAPTSIYVREVLGLIGKYSIKGLAHITGGGFDNIDRILPNGLSFRIDEEERSIPPIFAFLQQAGGLSDAEMRKTFNMGVGMVLAVAPEQAAAVLGENPEIFCFGKII